MMQVVSQLVIRCSDRRASSAHQRTGARASTQGGHCRGILERPEKIQQKRRGIHEEKRRKKTGRLKQ